MVLFGGQWSVRLKGLAKRGRGRRGATRVEMAPKGEKKIRVKKPYFELVSVVWGVGCVDAEHVGQTARSDESHVLVIVLNECWTRKRLRQRSDVLFHFVGSFLLNVRQEGRHSLPQGMHTEAVREAKKRNKVACECFVRTLRRETSSSRLIRPSSDFNSRIFVAASESPTLSMATSDSAGASFSLRPRGILNKKKCQKIRFCYSFRKMVSQCTGGPLKVECQNSKLERAQRGNWVPMSTRVTRPGCDSEVAA